MDAALVLAAGLMGLAGSPHCAAMCGAPCMALARRCGGARPHEALAGFTLGRLVGYAAGGALVAAGVASFTLLAQAAPALRSVWLLVQLAVLALGGWLLLTGRPPAWWARLGRAPTPAVAAVGGWQRMAGPLRAGAAGSLWLAWPCGLLQSALLVAALADRPALGATAMAAFAATSSIGLWLPGALWTGPAAGVVARARATAWAWRLAGAALLAASGFALGHGLWLRVAAWCGTP